MARRRSNKNLSRFTACEIGKVISPITKAIQSRVEQSFGIDNKEKKVFEDRCPGENHCGMFQVAIAETGNGLDACKGCDLLPTKPGNQIDKPESEPSNRLDVYVSNLYRIRSSRLSGFPKSESEITYLQYQSLVTLEYLIEQIGQVSEIKNRMLMEELIKSTAQPMF